MDNIKMLLDLVSRKKELTDQKEKLGVILNAARQDKWDGFIMSIGSSFGTSVGLRGTTPNAGPQMLELLELIDKHIDHNLDIIEQYLVQVEAFAAELFTVEDESGGTVV